MFLPNLIFLIFFLVGIFSFIQNSRKVYRNICLGIPINRYNNKKLRWKRTIKVALGQSKMFERPISGVLHFFVYIGFLIVSLELFEIIVDGIFGTHRCLFFIFRPLFYGVFTAILEICSFFVIFSVIIFFIRRNIFFINRFSFDLKKNSKSDANNILIIEFVLISLFFLMNASDYFITKKGFFPISTFLFFFIQNFSVKTLFLIERFSWWLHFLVILFFLNYLYYSKHLHIFLAFPSVFFSNIQVLGKFNNLNSVTQEVKIMLEPNESLLYDEKNNKSSILFKFGASDIFDLNRVQLLNAYTCTECGRCSDNCPANLTGKKLSPRKILMDTRDRLEEVSKNIDANNGIFISDKKQLLGDYISEEEIWSCTTCNACTDSCPIFLDPLSIIIDIRRYLVMEKSKIPQGINLMIMNIENNGDPWKFNKKDRINWINELG